MPSSLYSFLYAVGFCRQLSGAKVDRRRRALEFERGHRRRPAAARHICNPADEPNSFKPAAPRKCALRSFRTVSPFAWRHVEMRTERLVEIRQVVESPPISDFRNVQRLLVRITQGVAAPLKPVFEQPVTERLADLPKP